MPLVELTRDTVSVGRLQWERWARACAAPAILGYFLVVFGFAWRVLFNRLGEGI